MTVDLQKLVSLAEAGRKRTHARPEPSNKKWYEIRNRADSDTTDVYIYEDIGVWGITAQDFVSEFSQITSGHINIRVNSQGGSVFDGVTIYNTIKNATASTTGVVDGVAASAASFILMATDTIEMEKASRMMIHDAGIGGFYAEGNAAQLREAMKDLGELADVLDDLSNMIAQIYVDRAGGTVESWRNEMATDKWYTAEQAVEKGLADRIAGQPDDAENKLNRDINNKNGTAPTTEWDVEGLFNVLKGAFA